MRWIIPAIGLLLGADASAQASGSRELLLREYAPKSSLRVPAHPVPKARHPVINMHTHLRRANPERTIAAMDALNVQTLINLDGGFGEGLKEQVRRFKDYPGRVIHFARIDWTTIDDPDFSEKATRSLEGGREGTEDLEGAGALRQGQEREARRRQ